MPSHSMDVTYCASKEIMSASQKELTESNAQMLLTLSGIAGGYMKNYSKCA